MIAFGRFGAPEYAPDEPPTFKRDVKGNVVERFYYNNWMGAWTWAPACEDPLDHEKEG